MNRLVLIGNGFDLAHGLKTSYADFIYWYWEKRVRGFANEHSDTSSDILCTFKNLNKETWSGFYMYRIPHHLQKVTGAEVVQELFKDRQHYKITPSFFFANILQCLYSNNWVDIENEYYSLLTEYALRDENGEDKIEELNEQFCYLRANLIDYLKEMQITDDLIKSEIRNKIYSPFKASDISIEGQPALREHVESGLKFDDNVWDIKLRQYGSNCYSKGYVSDYKKNYPETRAIEWSTVPIELLLPNQILLLSFNYTCTTQLYCKDAPIFNVNQIHGKVEQPESVIFGYGDELDEDYKEITELNDNKLLKNIKSIKYLEADNYRKMLSFLESEPFQVLIMGHSCGNSDRTLLNTIFEHKNCVSIKPYFYFKEKGKDNYLDIVQNIHRNFTDMKLMRDGVVNKMYCETLTGVLK